MPTLFDYDYAESHFLISGQGGGASRRLIIPRSESGAYYVRLDLRDPYSVYIAYWDDNGHPVFRTVEERFNIVVSELPFMITSLDPPSVGNTGPATLKLEATNVSPLSTIQLIDGSQVVQEALRIDMDENDRSKAYVTFDFTGLGPGAYEVRIVDPHGESASAPLEVVEGRGPWIGAMLEGPNPVRLSRTYVFYINYGNTGDTDGIAPLLVLRNLDENAFALNREELNDELFEREPLQVLGISYEGIAGMLRPGELASIPVYYYTNNC